MYLAKTGVGSGGGLEHSCNLVPISSYILEILIVLHDGFPRVPVVKNPPANAGDIRDSGSILGPGRSPGGKHGNPLQYSSLGNPMDRGTWRTQLKQLSKHTHRDH